MLRKLFAALLVVLTVLPFTAPFPSYELGHSTSSTTSPGHSHMDDGSQALPVLAAAGRHRTRVASLLETIDRATHAESPRPYSLHVPERSAAPGLRVSLTALRI